MCGRVNVSDHGGITALLAMMGMQTWPLSPARFNVAPSGVLDVVKIDPDSSLSDDSTGGRLTLSKMTWGFTSYSKQAQSKRLINARSETVFSKPSFSESARQRRAIVVINGFYEWHVDKQGQRRAFYISLTNTPAMALAAVYQNRPVIKTSTHKTSTDKCDIQMSLDLHDEHTPVPDVPTQPNTIDKQVCILTREANQQMQAIHHRMPLIINSEQAQQWLNLDDKGKDRDHFFQNQANLDSALTIRQVDGYVNRTTNEGVKCLASAGTKVDW